MSIDVQVDVIKTKLMISPSCSDAPSDTRNELDAYFTDETSIWEMSLSIWRDQV